MTDTSGKGRGTGLLPLCTGALLSAVAVAPAQAESPPIRGFDFTLPEIEQHCEVYLRSSEWGEVNCELDKLHDVQRLCEARMYSEWDGELHCMNPLWDLNDMCEVEMRTYSYGDIKCKRPEQ